MQEHEMGERDVGLQLCEHGGEGRARGRRGETQLQGVEINFRFILSIAEVIGKFFVCFIFTFNPGKDTLYDAQSYGFWQRHEIAH